MSHVKLVLKVYFPDLLVIGLSRGGKASSFIRDIANGVVHLIFRFFEDTLEGRLLALCHL